MCSSNTSLILRNSSTSVFLVRQPRLPRLDEIAVIICSSPPFQKVPFVEDAQGHKPRINDLVECEEQKVHG